MRIESDSDPARIFRVIHPDSTVHWRSFTSNLLSLHRSGWRLSIRRSEYDHSSRILGEFSWGDTQVPRAQGLRVYHRPTERVRFISDSIDHAHWARQHYHQPNVAAIPLSIGIEMGPSITVGITEMVTLKNNATFVNPEFGVRYEGNGIEDFWKIFDDPEPEKIIVAEPTILEMLEKIKDRQLPKARELVHKQITEKARLYIENAADNNSKFAA